MVAVWIITLSFLALCIELLAGNAGLTFPMIGLTSFYVFTVFGWEKGLLPLAVVAVILDATLGRPSFSSVLMLAPIALFAFLWHRRGECGRVSLQAFPGLVVGLFWGTFLLAAESVAQEHVSVGLLRHDAWLLLQFVLFGIAGLPLVCRVGDFVSGRLGLPVYCRSQQGRRMRHGR